LNAEPLQFWRQFPADTPDIAYRYLSHYGFQLANWQGKKIEYTVNSCRMKSLFQYHLTEFGNGLCLGNAEADWQAQPFSYLLPDLLRVGRAVGEGQWSPLLEYFVNVKERRTAMDMTSAQTFRYSISDVGCP